MLGNGKSALALCQLLWLAGSGRWAVVSGGFPPSFRHKGHFLRDKSRLIISAAVSAPGARVEHE